MTCSSSLIRDVWQDWVEAVNCYEHQLAKVADTSQVVCQTHEQVRGQGVLPGSRKGVSALRDGDPRTPNRIR